MYVFENDKHLEANDRYIKILRLSHCIFKKIYFSYFLISPSFVAKVHLFLKQCTTWHCFENEWTLEDTIETFLMHDALQSVYCLNSLCTTMNQA